ncbi:hypothetical protein MLD38_010573 [Melastoma candidum]|uniref:Uncharacterized protein n=1 Tax=Melastoma candidum TaxID=119954 RepID=A0ACB9R095_9MYRT|nr:hypothetical protein MLD38_010573 [Melastoma candidum]
MSKPQEPQRPLFPFGNPFRALSPKGSRLPQSLVNTLNDFEESLAGRLKSLEPKVAGDVLSLSWLELAMRSLCDTHYGIKNLISTLDLPVCDWEEKWVDVYLDISVKLLDICIIFSSELSRLNQGRLFVQCGLHNLESHSPKQCDRARSFLGGWRKQTTSRNPKIDSCCSLLDGLMASLDLPKVKNSAKGKVLMRAMYGVKVQTIFVCSVFHAALSGSTRKLVEINVADSFPWAASFSNLRTSVNDGVRSCLASGRTITCKELEVVDANVMKLYPMIQDGVDAGEDVCFNETVAQASKSLETLSQALELLTICVDGFFQIVLSGRDALLCNLRADSKASHQKVRANVGRLAI